MAAQGQPNQAASSNSRSQGTRTGSKWSENEEAWLVVNCMKDVTTAWLVANFPGRARGLNGITGHLADMRLHNRLSKKWRHKSWNDESPYTLREDIEIMQWHIWGREHLDPQIFVPNQRAGGSVIARADYLCRDEELVKAVKEAEETAQEALEARDEACFNAENETADGPVDQSAMRMMNRILFRTESDSIVKICDAISRSLWNREFGGDDEDNEDNEDDEEDKDDEDDEDDEDGEEGEEEEPTADNEEAEADDLTVRRNRKSFYVLARQQQ
ncbi:hypothetical protein MaudMau93_006964 [Microsporum audouinii]